ncbi:tail assembly protein [Hafnia paralvei]|nr:tail assembly protein [Hafnia paralvei]
MKNLKTALLTPSANILACQLFGANVSIRQLTLGELYDYEAKLKTLQDKNDAHATSLLGAELVLSAIVDETGVAIHLVPIIIGSKRGGLFQTILGVALIGAATFFSGGLATAFTASGVWGGAMALTGASMALGGVVQMLSPQQAGIRMRQDPDNKPSYAFGGPVNSTAQGNPVAIGYGEREIGGAVISAGIYTEDQQ